MANPTAIAVVQPMPMPATFEQYCLARPRMIDTAGRPLALSHCPRCRREHFTVEPHADEVPCPVCGSTSARCARPSEWEAASWHRGRTRAFEALCSARQAAGIPQVAPWPTATEPEGLLP